MSKPKRTMTKISPSGAVVAVRAFLVQLVEMDGENVQASAYTLEEAEEVLGELRQAVKVMKLERKLEAVQRGFLGE